MENTDNDNIIYNISRTLKMEKDNTYFENQIKGLIIILEEGSHNGEKPVIHRNYVIEKLTMILGGGIGFHELINEKLVV